MECIGGEKWTQKSHRILQKSMDIPMT